MALGNGERYYSPGLARFTQQDSFNGVLDLPSTLNWHAYVSDNPNRFTDPSGNSVLDVVSNVATVAAFGVFSFAFSSSSTNSYGERRDADLLYKAAGLDPNNRPSGVGLWLGEHVPGMKALTETIQGQDYDRGQMLTGRERFWRGASAAFDLVSDVLVGILLAQWDLGRRFDGNIGGSGDQFGIF